VELFRELEIEDDPAFVDVIQEFRSTGEASRSTLLRATVAFLRQADRREAEVLVLDALFAFLPSLLAWGDTDEQIHDFFRRMAEVFSGFRVLEIHLCGDLRAALDRATSREGSDWLAAQVKKTAGFRGAPPISTPDEAIGYLEVLSARATSVLEKAPWTVAVVDADTGVDGVLATAHEVLRPHLP
jgi:hypothetical protein